MLELLNIGKSFSSQTALSGISLSIASGEFLSLLGPSGCGKTTLLRIISGLETPSEGKIILNGQSIEGLGAAQRPFNLVFQRYALFPHLTVSENVAFGLKIKKLPKSEIQARVMEALELVEMSSFAKRMPETLSGGQAQRVAIARALVNRPQILLLDEPLSALDQRLREHMQRELRQLQKKLGIAFIYVTHDQEEALFLSDRICIMERGSILKITTPQEIYESVDVDQSSSFLGSSSRLQGELVEFCSEYATVKLADGSLIKGKYQIPNSELSLGMTLDTYVRKAMHFGRDGKKDLSDKS